MLSRVDREELKQAAPNPVSHPRTKRQYRSVEERRRIVEETLVPGVSVARAHGINANQVFGWRKLYQAGLIRPNNVASSDAHQSSVRLLSATISVPSQTFLQQFSGPSVFFPSRLLAEALILTISSVQF